MTGDHANVESGDESGSQGVGQVVTRATSPIADPRRRDFLPQTPRERWRGWWWQWVRRVMFRHTPKSCNGLRMWVLRRLGATIGRGAWIHPKARIEFPWNLTLGENVMIRQHVLLECMGPITIGEGTRISQFAHLVSGTHDYHRPDMRIERRPIVVGSGVWIAADAFIGPGVTIGDGAIIGARSGVFSDVPPHVMARGSRAKPVRDLPAPS